MYVNPFLAGVIATVLCELIIVLGLSWYYGGK